MSIGIAPPLALAAARWHRANLRADREVGSSLLYAYKEREPVTMMKCVTGSLNAIARNKYLRAGGWGLAGCAGRDGDGEILTVWSGLKLDRGVRAHADFALHLRVAIEDKLHGVFCVSIIHFDRE
jgi:hypothetical protein